MHARTSPGVRVRRHQGHRLSPFTPARHENALHRNARHGNALRENTPRENTNSVRPSSATLSP